MYKLIFGIVAILIASASASAQERRTSATGDGVLVDFQDVDIRHVITALAEAGQLNVSYADIPSRPVTLRLNQPVPKHEIAELLRGFLESLGLVVENAGSLLRVSAPKPAPPPPPLPAPGSTELRIFVHRLQHAPATQLASTLQALFGGGAIHPFASGLSRGGLSSELRQQQIAPLTREPPAPQTSEGSGQIAISGRLQAEVQIVPDELTNSLLVRASPADWEVVKSAIELLDLRPLQVLIEVLIAEVRKGSLFDLGLSVEVPQQREPRTGAEIGGKLLGSTGGDLVLKILNLGPSDADVLISAISSRSDVTIISRPVVLAQNNQEARILIGSERPFVQVFRALPTDAAVRDQVVQYRDVGTALTIRPTINQDGYVSLDLVQEVSTATNETQFGAPVISTREAATRLLVRDGQTAVIGGLIDRQRETVRSGIPVLKDIPLLGWLFGSTQTNRTQSELFLFITPHVVRTDEDTDRMREDVQRNTEMLKDRLPEPGTIVDPARPNPEN